MASNTYRSFLMTSEDGSEWNKLIDIKDYPDLGGEPEMLETTTLSDSMQTYIPGIQSLDALQFTCNYTLEDYKKLKALAEKEKHYAVWFGGTGTGESLTPTGTDGKYKFMGQLSVFVVGKGVNDVKEMTVSIAPSTEIELDESE